MVKGVPAGRVVEMFIFDMSTTFPVTVQVAGIVLTRHVTAPFVKVAGVVN